MCFVIFCRYACIHPHGHIVFCTIFHEFGKKGDMMSALTLFEASKQKLSGPNMYAYNTIIDVCGLCGDNLKSRSIYEELLAKKVTPDGYVFNSLMNVNACDLSYAMHVYEHMRNWKSRIKFAAILFYRALAGSGINEWSVQLNKQGEREN
ncbi:hypothetical protein RHSIM_Rhsim04G0181000 [Rhododendron simsii]|uniref:Pentatricopeptide repeat-containing protein n=1 Tax=Rhododendron simsii TaxID=118357 RepID=A0A834H3Z1_RHOSS|nr:hypothetical protein RHSIM_Rhsim04G0181000 [Rhododendron simsii]